MLSPAQCPEGTLNTVWKSESRKIREEMEKKERRQWGQCEEEMSCVGIGFGSGFYNSYPAQGLSNSLQRVMRSTLTL